jgi:hypothetical protein
MVNKGVGQLPVVRAGELVGFLSVETALQLLFHPEIQEEKAEGRIPPEAPGE